jgi:hypothetical protein
VITDPSALINNLRPGRENDDIWYARSNALPAVGMPVEIRLRLTGRIGNSGSAGGRSDGKVDRSD